ncbi:MAG: hypothetical protein R3B70_46640 [Polyangiaceae bacterium]
MPTPPLPAASLRDLLGLIRTLWWARWASGALEDELRLIASIGDDVTRLLRASRFEACATTWHQARLAMRRVIDLGERIPSEDLLLRSAARRVLSVPGVPPPPLHAYAAQSTELPDP